MKGASAYECEPIRRYPGGTGCLEGGGQVPSATIGRMAVDSQPSPTLGIDDRPGVPLKS